MLGGVVGRAAACALYGPTIELWNARFVHGPMILSKATLAGGSPLVCKASYRWLAHQQRFWLFNIMSTRGTL